MGKLTKDDVIFFYRTENIYSQFHPCAFTVDGILYDCAEKFMMAEKARLFKDGDTLDAILTTPGTNPRGIKALGRCVQGFDEDKWETHREKIVYNGNYAKFSQNPSLKKQLISTGEAMLVEASPSDKIWGIGLSEKTAAATPPPLWPGLNLLGKAIMKVRDTLVSEEAAFDTENKVDLPR